MCHGLRKCAWLFGFLVASGGRAEAAPSAPAEKWVATWATAPQPAATGSAEKYANETIRLVVHTSVGGSKARVRLSNAFGTTPLTIEAARIAVRTAEAQIEPTSDRELSFDGKPSLTIEPKQSAVSDALDFDVPALGDVAVSLFFKSTVIANTSHLLALQTSYVVAGNQASAPSWAEPKRITSWPFLTGLEVAVTEPAAKTVVAFGDSSVDGDGTTPDTNQRWPDALAARLQAPGVSHRDGVGVINEGIIGNRLLRDSPRGVPPGPLFGPSGLSRFDKDVLSQPGLAVVIVRFGANDLGFPGAFAPKADAPTAEALIAGFRALLAQAKKKAPLVRVIGTTITPFEGTDLAPGYFSMAKEKVRLKVNEWLRTTSEFAAVVDCDAVVRDPANPSRLLPSYDSGDHIHVNDAGHLAIANAISVEALEGDKTP